MYDIKKLKRDIYAATFLRDVQPVGYLWFLQGERWGQICSVVKNNDFLKFFLDGGQLVVRSLLPLFTTKRPFLAIN